MVSMRFAANLAAGDGLVWNPGEVPVEGYSNLLWTLWMAVLHLVPVPEQITPLLVSLSGAVLLVASASAAARICALLNPDASSWACRAAALLVGTCYPLMFWTLRGMEVGLLALLIALAVERSLRISRGSGQGLAGLSVCLILLTLTRPDGVVPALAIAAMTGAAVRERWRTLFILAGTICVTFGSHALLRHAYYGDWLPNTYYLKMTGVSLGERLARGIPNGRFAVIEYLGVPLLLAAAASLNPRRIIDALLIIVPAALLAYAVYVGGDAWEWMPYTNRYVTPAVVLLFPAALAGATARDGMVARFYTPLLLLIGAIELMLALRHAEVAHQLTHGAIALAAFAAAASTGAGWPRHSRVALVSIAVWVSVSGPGFGDWLGSAGAHVRDDARMSIAGRATRESTSEQASIAVVWAGSLPYFAHRPTIDLMGKSDPIIARMTPATGFIPGHNKFDYAHSVGRGRPDLVLQLWARTPAIDQWLSDTGYEHLTPNVFVRRDSRLVDRARLAATLPATLP